MSNVQNPFPTDEEVRFITSLSSELLGSEFGAAPEDEAFDPEPGLRASTLAKCLVDARHANGWTQKACAQWLSAPLRQVRALEGSDFAKWDVEVLGRYVHLLGLEELYGQWLTANPGLAAQLGLSALATSTSRPADWPAVKPFVLPADTFHIPPEAQQKVKERLETLRKQLGTLSGLGLPGSSSRPPELPPAAPPAIYQLKVTLRDVRPPIWRRLQVPNSLTLGQLHEVLQWAMGWENGHLHEFRLGETHFGMTHDPLGGPLEMQGAWDEEAYRLADLGLRTKSKLTYEYDFGDGWEHELVVEKVLPPRPDFVPICLGGARACPPEDSGGPWGYAEQLDALADPKHPAHADTVEWLGKSFDPEAFDLEAINRELASLAQAW